MTGSSIPEKHPGVCSEDRHEAHLYRVLVKELGEYAIFLINCEGMIASWNTGVECLLGYTEAEFVGRPFSIIFTHEDIEEGAPKKELDEARLSGRGADERWHIRQDGTQFFAGGVVTAVRDADGSLIGFSKVLHDVTAQKESEQKLVMVNQRLTKLAHALDLTPSLIRNLDGTITTWTSGAEALYGWSANDARGKVSTDLLRTEFRTPLCEIKQILLDKGEWQGEVKHYTKDQRPIHVATRWVVHYDEDNTPFRVIEADIDISDLKRAEEALKQSNLELSSFAHEIAHDLQTPLRNIQTHFTVADQAFQNFFRSA